MEQQEASKNSEFVHHPHDMLFKAIFSDPTEAAAFLQEHLPAKLSAQLDWSTLQLEEGSYVDEALRHSESDLLFSITHMGLQENISLYLLFDHQSSPDKWMAFRLLKYRCRIWDESFKTEHKPQTLKPILPVVFYQGERGWTYSIEFADLFPEETRTWSFIPHLTYFLVDQSGIKPEEVKGEIRGRIVQLLMLAAFHEQVRDALLAVAQLWNRIPQTGGINYAHVFIQYVLATQDNDKLAEFDAMLKARKSDIGDEIVTYAQQLLLEGKNKGKIEGKIEGQLELIEGFLRAGVGWATIVEATGVDQAKFAELKAQLARLQGQPAG